MCMRCRRNTPEPRARGWGTQSQKVRERARPLPHASMRHMLIAVAFITSYEVFESLRSNKHEQHHGHPCEQFY